MDVVLMMLELTMFLFSLPVFLLALLFGWKTICEIRSDYSHGPDGIPLGASPP